MYEDLKKIIDGSDKMVFFGGAGVSTESGIPDFRSEDGIHNAMTKYNLPPEVIISLPFFEKKPEIFYDYYISNLLRYKEAQPNKAHLALAKLESQNKLLAVVTQNIDGLHQKGGSKNVLELHGSMHRNYCMKCRAFYETDYLLEPENCENGVPLCKKCSGIVKPDVVLYREHLDQKVVSAAVDAIGKADVLIVGGTSLVVYPAAGYLNHFKGSRLILINKSKTDYDSMASLVINDSIGVVLGSVVD